MDYTERQADTSPSREQDVVAEALSYTKKAEELRTVAIKQLLEQRDRIDRDLKALGYSLRANGNGLSLPFKADGAKAAVLTLADPSPRRFKDMKLAEVGRLLIMERGSLHGKEIERLAKAGGFKGGTNNFQNYLPVAFKRDGGFENIGGNTWKLKESA